MKEPTAIVTAEYKVYNDETRTTYAIGESGDSPTLTEIIQKDGHTETRLVIENENLPKLIEALQRRLQDCLRDPEA
jgi:hypothetical protein